MYANDLELCFYDEDDFGWDVRRFIWAVYWSWRGGQPATFSLLIHLPRRRPTWHYSFTGYADGQPVKVAGYCGEYDGDDIVLCDWIIRLSIPYAPGSMVRDGVLPR